MKSSEWYRDYGCEYPTIIDCIWIYTDKELEFQRWLDNKKETDG